MPKVKPYSEPDGVIGYSFQCPGCKETHAIPTAPGQPHCWGFNGDVERPTFTPSILARTGHYLPGWKPPHCWCNYNERFPDPVDYKCGVCHSFVTDGNIQFLSDCTHDLAGQTVPLPEIDL